LTTIFGGTNTKLNDTVSFFQDIRGESRKGS